MTDPSTCRAFEEDLSALLDGELEAAREAEVRAHAAGCTRCAERLARLTRVDEALRSLPEAETPADLAERLRVRLDEERRRSSASAEDRGRSLLQGRSSNEARRRSSDEARDEVGGRSSDARQAPPSHRPPPRRRRWIPLAGTALAAAAALALYLVVGRPRPAGEEPMLAERERPAPEREIARREPPPEPLPDELVSGPELEAIQAASDEELALALDLDTLADFAVIERLHVLEQLAALDGAG
jgi:anti-sigma factor RsiW